MQMACQNKSIGLPFFPQKNGNRSNNATLSKLNMFRQLFQLCCPIHNLPFFRSSVTTY